MEDEVVIYGELLIDDPFPELTAEMIKYALYLLNEEG